MTLFCYIFSQYGKCDEEILQQQSFLPILEDTFHTAGSKSESTRSNEEAMMEAVIHGPIVVQLNGNGLETHHGDGN